MVSMKTKYALMALVAMARATDKGTFLIADIAKTANVPKKFLEAILLTLKNQGILSSRKGPGGGYSLAVSPAALTIGSVVRAFEGDLSPVECLSESARGTCPECGSDPACGIRLVMADVKAALTSVLDKVTLAEMIERSNQERQKLSQQIDYSI